MESEADLRKRQKLEVKAQKAAANEAMLGKKGDERKKLERVHGDIGVALERRHMKEWQALEAATEAAAEGGSSAAGAEDAAAADGAGAELGAMSLGGGGVASSGSKKQPEVELDASGRPRRDGPSRADKKRKEKAAADAARERAVAEAAQGAPNLREEELNEIRRKLSPMGLTVREIAADGNCLYRAIADQLDLVTAGPPQGGPRGEQPYVAVRAMAAKFMRDHPGDFQPFLTLEGAGSPNDLYRAYCDKVAFTSEWGGQPELRALASELRCCIWVHSAIGAVVKMGEAFGGPPLHVSFHRHYYSLGDHYNSVVPDGSGARAD